MMNFFLILFFAIFYILHTHVQKRIQKNLIPIWPDIEKFPELPKMCHEFAYISKTVPPSRMRSLNFFVGPCTEVYLETNLPH